MSDQAEDSGSDYGKRERITNNHNQDNDTGLSRRPHFNRNKSAVLVGVWKNSPPSDPAKKHAVYAFLDVADKIRQKVYPETRDGKSFLDGHPSGTGRAFITLNSVILDYHLSDLSRQALKEYVRIRMSRPLNELPEKRREAEALAIEEAVKLVSKSLLQTSQPFSNTLATHSKTSNPDEPKEIPNGIFLGLWKDSSAAKISDKHATFGVVDCNRLRVKIIEFTRAGRPYQGNIPTDPDSSWISLDEVVREPALQNLLYPQMIEYVKLRQSEHGRPDFNPFLVDEHAIEKALETSAVIGKAQDYHTPYANTTYDISRTHKPPVAIMSESQAVENASGSFGNNYSRHPTVGPYPSPVTDVRSNNDVTYVRQDSGPFVGKMVGDKKEILTIDGENYVECRVLMKSEF